MTILRYILLVCVVVLGMHVFGAYITIVYANDEDFQFDNIVLIEDSVVTGYDINDDEALGDYLNNAFRLGISIATGLAVVMIAVGGIGYMVTGSISGKEKGLDQVRGAVYGLILAFASWLILNQINPEINKLSIVDRITDAKLSAVAQRENIDVSDLVSWPKPFKGDGKTYSYGEEWPDDSKERDYLRSGGIGWNNENCQTAGQKGCTSFYKISKISRDHIINVKRKCSDFNKTECEIVATGGSEFWLHSTHVTNQIDLRPNDQLNAYIMEASGGGQPVAGQTYSTPDQPGVSFTWEPDGHGGYSTGDHWHVVVP